MPWRPLQNFPSADGSRVLRTTVSPMALDLLYGFKANGIRQTFVVKHGKLFGKIEVMTTSDLSNEQLNERIGHKERSKVVESYSEVIKSKQSARELGSNKAVDGSNPGDSNFCKTNSALEKNSYSWIDIEVIEARDKALLMNYTTTIPVQIIERLRNGVISAVSQKLTLADYDTTSSSMGVGPSIRMAIPSRAPAVQKENDRKIRNHVTVELLDGSLMPMGKYMQTFQSDVEMCLPLSSEEGKALFDVQSVRAIRHTCHLSGELAPHLGDQMVPQTHSVQLSQSGETWTDLPAHEKLIPHFRLYNQSNPSIPPRTSKLPWISSA